MISGTTPTSFDGAGEKAFLSEPLFGKVTLEFTAGRQIFRQGDSANSVFYLRQGTVKLSTQRGPGREAIVALVNPGEFFGEACLVGQKTRREAAIAVTDCRVEKIEKPTMTRLLAEREDTRDAFLAHLFSRNMRYEEDLVDQVCNDSERRLARILMRLSDVEAAERNDAVVAGFHQGDLAQMIGTTRPRVSHFMSVFKKDGLIDYNREGTLTIHRDRLTAALESRLHRSNRRKDRLP